MKYIVDDKEYDDPIEKSMVDVSGEYVVLIDNKHEVYIVLDDGRIADIYGDVSSYITWDKIRISEFKECVTFLVEDQEEYLDYLINVIKNMKRIDI